MTYAVVPEWVLELHKIGGALSVVALVARLFFKDLVLILQIIGALLYLTTFFNLCIDGEKNEENTKKKSKVDHGSSSQKRRSGTMKDDLYVVRPDQNEEFKRDLLEFKEQCKMMKEVIEAARASNDEYKRDFSKFRDHCNKMEAAAVRASSSNNGGCKRDLSNPVEEERCNNIKRDLLRVVEERCSKVEEDLEAVRASNEELALKMAEEKRNRTKDNHKLERDLFNKVEKDLEVVRVVEERCNRVEKDLEVVRSDISEQNRVVLKIAQKERNKLFRIEQLINKMGKDLEGVRAGGEEHERKLSRVEEQCDKVEKDLEAIREDNLEYDKIVLKIAEEEGNCIMKHVEAGRSEDRDEYKRVLLRLEERCDKLEKREEEMLRDFKRLEEQNKEMLELLQQHKNYQDLLEDERKNLLDLLNMNHQVHDDDDVEDEFRDDYCFVNEEFDQLHVEEIE